MMLPCVCLAALAVISMSLNCQAFYVALAPTSFRNGWTYNVQLYVGQASGIVTVQGNIYDTKNSSIVVASGSVQIAPYEQGMLRMQVSNAFSGDFTLKLAGSGGLSFTNTTSVQLQRKVHLTFIQTDKPMYKPGDLVHMRGMTVDKDLNPQPVTVTVSLENAIKSTVFRNTSYNAFVFEQVYQLFEFSEIGEWTVTVKNETYDIEEKLTFSVQEHVLPKFEVSAHADSYVLKSDPKVALHITAKYTYGEGVVGSVKVTVSSQRMLPSQIVNGKMQDGTGEKTIEIDLSRELSGDQYVYAVDFLVEVTDETQRTYNTTVSTIVEREPVRVKFDDIRTDRVFRPGLPLHAVVTFTDPGGRVLDASFRKSKAALSLLDSRYSRTIATKEITLQEEQMEVNWVINLNASDSTTDSLMLKASLGVYEASTYISRYRTIQNASLDVRVDGDADTLLLGQQTSFTVKTSGQSRFSSVNYIIVSRGNIQKFGSVTPGMPISLKVSTDMCPNGRLIVYGITEPPSGDLPELIAASVELKLQQCQEKSVKTQLRQSRQRTGTDASVDFAVEWTDSSRSEAVGQHNLYLLAVDKSVTLLPGDNDVTSEKVDSSLQVFDLLPAERSYADAGILAARKKRSIMPPGRWPTSSGISTTGELFDGVGVVCLTDMLVKGAEYYGCLDCIMFKADDIQAAVPDVMEEAAGQAFPMQVQVRKEFPDTWMWASGLTDVSGQYTMQAKLPDSITSWIISAFAVRANSSLAVSAQRAELQAFNPFFVSLKLPYSIRRTEKFELRATVFNYQEASVNVAVTLSESPGNFTIEGDSMKTVTVKKGLPASVVFLVIAERIGTITFAVKAKSELPVLIDQLEEKLIVKPEGLERARASTAPIILSGSQPEVNKEFTFEYSPWTLSDVVQGSRKAQATVTGDMMGNAMENLDKLVSMPTGCGEQNMLTTVPNIFGLKYARAVNKARPEFEKKTLDYMSLGYKRELQYRNDTDGSFSAFTTDVEGSTWLTAFVVKSFAQARAFIPNDIDTSILAQAIRFLFSRQSRDGSFHEIGRVIHTEMQGGTAGGDPLTVFVVQCLLEAQKYGIEVDEVRLATSLQFVKNKIKAGGMQDKVFISALAAYTLALDSPTGNAVTITRLLQNVIDTGAPWRQEKKADGSKGGDAVYFQSGPGDIEITSYVLLTYNILRQFSEGRELLLWLQKNQNGIGGFASTQDTVLGLQAMSEFSANFKDAVPGGTAVITPVLPGGRVGLPQTVVIDPNNADLVHYVLLPDETVGVQAKVTGGDNSIVIVQVKWTFYTPADIKLPPIREGSLAGNDNLIITSFTTADNVRKDLYRVGACIKPGQALTYSQMTLVIIQPPSGMDVDDFEKVKHDNPDCFMEKKDDQIVCYLHSPKEMCVNVELQEVVRVENRKPAAAQVIAYYQPTIQAEAPIRIPTAGCAGDCPASVAAVSIASVLLSATVCLLLSLLVAL